MCPTGKNELFVGFRGVSHGSDAVSYRGLLS